MFAIQDALLASNSWSPDPDVQIQTLKPQSRNPNSEILTRFRTPGFSLLGGDQEGEKVRTLCEPLARLASHFTYARAAFLFSREF